MECHPDSKLGKGEGKFEDAELLTIMKFWQSITATLLGVRGE